MPFCFRYAQTLHLHSFTALCSFRRKTTFSPLAYNTFRFLLFHNPKTTLSKMAQLFISQAQSTVKTNCLPQRIATFVSLQSLPTLQSNLVFTFPPKHLFHSKYPQFAFTTARKKCYNLIFVGVPPGFCVFESSNRSLVCGI